MNIETFNPETELVSVEETMKYRIGIVPKIDEMRHQKSISDIVIDQTKIKPLKALLLSIFARYLSVNIKSRSISNEFGYKLLLDFVLNDCKNLEIQEVEYIFKNGVMGRFGQIYNDISIDTICGLNGWIETYYKDHRHKRIDPTKQDDVVRFTGKEISEAEFYDKNPDYKENSRIKDLAAKAMEFRCGVQDLKEFYKLKGFTVGEMQDDLAVIAGKYYNSEYKDQITEKQFIDNWINNFIRQNYNKKKSQ